MIVINNFEKDFKTMKSMKKDTVYREMIVETDKFLIGDRIDLGKYTATCQYTDGYSGGVFLLDQYLDKSYNHKNLIEKMNADLAVDENFDGIRGRLEEWHLDEGKYPFRVPFAGEFFTGTEEDDWIKEHYKPDHKDGFMDIWPLMRDRKNRIALREGEPYEWGWLMNKVKGSATAFANVNDDGHTIYDNASNSFGVRPVFFLKM